MRLILDLNNEVVHDRVLTQIFLLFEICNAYLIDIEILTSGDARSCNKLCLKNLREPLNASKILEILNYVRNPTQIKYPSWKE